MSQSKSPKKLIVFSTEEIRDIIEDCVRQEAVERNVSQSVVIEEYILSGIARNFPDQKERIQNIYKARYEKYRDEFLIQ